MSSPQGRKTLRSIRLRAESANGTRATSPAPRWLWRGMGGLEDKREVTNPEEQIAVVGGGDRSYIAKVDGGWSFDESDLLYEQFSDILLMAGFGTVGGVQSGSVQGGNGSAVTFQLVAPVGSVWPTYSYTLEGGENEVEAEYAPYGLVTKIGIKGAGGEALKMTVEGISQLVERTNAAGTFTAVGTAPPVETVLSAGSWWITPSGSGFGTGQVTPGNILAFELNIESKWVPKWSVDSGTTYWGTAVLTDMVITGKTTFEFQRSGTYGAAGTAGQKQKWRDQETQLLRMLFKGGTIPSGTGYTSKSLQFDFPFKYTKFAPLGDMDGNSIVEAEWFSKYSETTPSAGRGTIFLVRRGTSEFSGA